MAHTLFVDFDGVFHPVGSCVWDADKQQMQAVDPFRWWPLLEAELKALPFPVDLVVHSTWRLMWETDEELLAMLPASMRGYIRGTTDRSIMGRERSVLDYASKNSLDHFLVLDDEPAAFAVGYAPLITCNGQHGLSQPSVLLALRERLAEWSLLEYGYGPKP